LETQVGGLSSLASQPSAFEFMGSLGMTVVLVWPHLGHSKVRMAEPQGRDPRLANSMRCCRQFGQPGRSIAETCGGDAGLNSGMMHCADLDSCGQESRHLKLHHGLFRASGRGQKCSNRKISSAKGERTRAPHLILRFKYRLSVFRDGDQCDQRCVRMRHARTNFAGQLSMRSSNLSVATSIGVST
jgi:hypothetical protein